MRGRAGPLVASSDRPVSWGLSHVPSERPTKCPVSRPKPSVGSEIVKQDLLRRTGGLGREVAHGSYST